jgi:hypothetical protein
LIATITWDRGIPGTKGAESQQGRERESHHNDQLIRRSVAFERSHQPRICIGGDSAQLFANHSQTKLLEGFFKFLSTSIKELFEDIAHFYIIRHFSKILTSSRLMVAFKSFVGSSLALDFSISVDR